MVVILSLETMFASMVRPVMISLIFKIHNFEPVFSNCCARLLGGVVGATVSMAPKLHEVLQNNESQVHPKEFDVQLFKELLRVTYNVLACLF